ncbi:MAG TPA: 2-dehydropantoate 2-reductase N-terminal domain-containing protein, partial [Pyrinomonadaceae bacterium]|nr:2-dehydropantoate 2-reductase N-terminal domain-containing protein [Pyrinomonadaceae bacterium]
MRSVAIIGIGRVGGALALSLPAEKYRVTGLVSREWTDEVTSLAARIDSARLVPPDDLENGLKADIVFFTTQDTELREAIAEYRGWLTDSVVFHTSGSTPSSVLEPLREGGNHIGSLHPLVAISSAELGPERFP